MQSNLFFIPVVEGKEEIKFILPNIVKSSATEAYISRNKIKTFPTNGKRVDAVVRELYRAKHPEEYQCDSGAENSDEEDE